MFKITFLIFSGPTLQVVFLVFTFRSLKCFIVNRKSKNNGYYHLDSLMNIHIMHNRVFYNCKGDNLKPEISVLTALSL